MKHVKIYEEDRKWIEDKLYKKYDYVKLTDDIIEENGIQDSFKNIGIIRKYIAIGQKTRVETHMYDVDYLNEDFEFKNIYDNYVYEKGIVKKLTQTEVGDLNVFIDTKKYNL